MTAGGIAPVAASRGYSLGVVLASSYGGFCWDRAWVLGAPASVAGACRLSCPVACGIFAAQGLNRCPVRWQVDS